MFFVDINNYPICRNPSTIFIRADRTAGNTAANRPTRNDNASASAIVRGSTLKTGNIVGKPSATAAAIGNVNAMPIQPPNIAMTNDSPATSPIMCHELNPKVFNTAYSRMRSRADMMIVLASTSRIMPMMTYEITSSDVKIALDNETKLCWNAFSVSVFVFADEFANRASTFS